MVTPTGNLRFKWLGSLLDKLGVFGHFIQLFLYLVFPFLRTPEDKFDFIAWAHWNWDTRFSKPELDVHGNPRLEDAELYVRRALLHFLPGKNKLGDIRLAGKIGYETREERSAIMIWSSARFWRRRLGVFPRKGNRA